MPKYIADDHKCGDCGHRYDGGLRTRDTREAPSVCPLCGKEGRRTISAPQINTVTVPDGTNRGRNFDIMKEITKLERQKANLPQDKRADIQKEINKRKKL